MRSGISRSRSPSASGNSEIATRYGLVASLVRTKDYPRAKSELDGVEKTRRRIR